MQSYHILGDQSLQIPFWTKVQGWCNPTTFSGTEVTGSILDRCPRMIQSLFILEDRSHRITSGQMSWYDTIPLILEGRGPRITLGQVPRDDTIPLQHHYSPFQGRSFRTTPTLSQKCLNFTRDRGFVSTSSSKPSSSTSSVCEYWTITIYISSMWILKAYSSIYSI